MSAPRVSTPLLPVPCRLLSAVCCLLLLLMLLTGSAAVPVHVMLVVQPARWGMSSPGCQLPDPNLTDCLPS